LRTASRNPSSVRVSALMVESLFPYPGTQAKLSPP
jgi:hypothetical protein